MEFTQKDLDLLEKSFKESIINFKALFTSRKGIMTIIEFIARFIPLALLIVIGSIISNYEPNIMNGFIFFGIPLFAVCAWIVIYYIAVKYFKIFNTMKEGI